MKREREREREASVCLEKHLIQRNSDSLWCNEREEMQIEKLVNDIILKKKARERERGRK